MRVKEKMEEEKEKLNFEIVSLQGQMEEREGVY